MVRKFVLKARHGEGGPDFSEELNPEQLAVVAAPGGPMLVIAGAGSGKTRALTYRLAWLVHHGVDPSRILLVTFTNRAAREMLHRVELLVQHDTESIWGGTFHHIANRILRKHGGRLGITPDFTILDREDARDLLRSCVVEAGIRTRERRFPQKAVLSSISSFVQNTLDPLPEVLATRYPMFACHEQAIADVLARYVEKKQRAQLLDYDDLLARWLELLEGHGPTRDLLAEQFQHILVDEYQDTNAIQGRIVDLLAARHRNVCVVGDDSQSIYSFRGASFENIIRFRERYSDAVEYRLETNYRSVPEIFALANASVAHNRRRLPKTLHAVRPSGLKPAVVTCNDHFVQSRFIAEYILYLHDEGRSLLDLAVLYRSHWHSLELQLEFQRRNIPFQVRGGLRYFEQAHIKDVLAFLRLVHNPRDELAWYRVLPLFPRVASGLTRRLWLHIAEAPDPVKEARTPGALDLFPAGARKSYEDFERILSDIVRLKSPAEIIERVLVRFYEDYLVSRFENGRLRAEDIRGLAAFAAQYNTVEAFLADVTLASEFAGETVVTGPEENDFVTLSTVHQAKGLEWGVVFIPWLADGRFPTDFAINTPEEEEEERRVFHVAVTRAKDELYLVVPQVFRRGSGRTVLMKPSRFLMELDGEHTEPMILEEGLPHVTVGEPHEKLPEATREEDDSAITAAGGEH